MSLRSDSGSAETAVTNVDQQKYPTPDGTVPREIAVSRSSGCAREESGHTEVSLHSSSPTPSFPSVRDIMSRPNRINWNGSFMFDKIMPLEDAVEGYELFDKMKVQKVIFKV